MQFEFEEKNNKHLFEDLQPGDVFLGTENDPFMKMQEVYLDKKNTIFNAVRLEDGALDYYDPNYFVQKLETKLILFKTK